MTDANRAWEELERRAAESRFSGITADSDDIVDNRDLREAAINPNAAGAKGRGAGNPGMMPPMMGAGGGSAGAGSAGGSAAVGGAVVDPTAAAAFGGLRAGTAPATAGGLGTLGGLAAGGSPAGSGAPVGLGAGGIPGGGGPVAAGWDGLGTGVDVDGDGVVDYHTGGGDAAHDRDTDGDGVSDYDEWVNHGGNTPGGDGTGGTGGWPGGSGFPGPGGSGPGGSGSGGSGGASGSGGSGGVSGSGGSGGVSGSGGSGGVSGSGGSSGSRSSGSGGVSGSGGSGGGSEGSDGGTATTSPDLVGDVVPPPLDASTLGVSPDSGPGTSPGGPGSTTGPGGSGTSDGGSSYTVDAESLRAAAKQWYALSDSVVGVASTAVPTELGFAAGASSVASMGSTATGWAAKASEEYRSIGDKLMSAAENYSGAEQANKDEASKVGH